MIGYKYHPGTSVLDQFLVSPRSGSFWQGKPVSSTFVLNIKKKTYALVIPANVLKRKLGSIISSCSLLSDKVSIHIKNKGRLKED